ncbi:MAG: hypothetical protein WBA13_20410 [Microcoleaceae cyanobacterium]
MNIHPKLTAGWLVFTVPFISTLSLNITPSQAATFSSATTQVTLTNFNLNAEASSVTVNPTAFAISPVGSDFNSDFLDDILAEESVTASAADDTVVATADFSTVASFPSIASGNNSSFVSSETANEAFGTGGSYIGKSKTESTVLANFFLNPEAGETQTFSFDFNAFWELETFVDKTREQSTATADVSLTVCGRNSLGENPLFCDSLSTFGQLDSSNTTDLFAFQKSDPFTIDVLNNPGISGSQNFKQTDFFALGSYQQEFDKPIYLSLAAVQSSEAYVSTPESSTTVALLSLTALTIALGKRKKKY